MMNGEKDLIILSVVSLSQLESLESRGHQHTPSSWGCVKSGTVVDMVARTKHLGLRSRSPMMLEPIDKGLAQKHAEIFCRYSTNDLMTMDRDNIKILGASFSFNEYDRNWAN